MEPRGRGRVERRLAAILAADVAGYSRLIEADEEGTLSRLRALRAEVLREAEVQYRIRMTGYDRSTSLGLRLSWHDHSLRSPSNCSTRSSNIFGRYM